ncbi:MAG: hypothetical protein AAF899_01105 [Pseudomonadota bacterium]
MSDAPSSPWKKVYSGMGVAEIRRLKHSHEEDGKLKRLVADFSLDKAKLQHERWRAIGLGAAAAGLDGVVVKADEPSRSPVVDGRSR